MSEIPPRLLLGSGPSPVPPRVLAALGRPTVGHLDPAFGAVMDEVAELLRATFRTANRATFPVSGTGSAGMDAMVANLVRPGDRVVCGVHGLFGERMADALGRQGAEVVRVEADWGRALDPDALVRAIGAAPTAACFVVHGETSTGVLQPLDGLGAACRDAGALLLVDAVTSLGGDALEVDGEGVDAAFSGTQKTLNAPPGLAPFTVGDRAAERVTPKGSRSWYLDLDLVLDYWRGDGGTRAYHHTAPVNMVYGLLEALRAVHEEGLEARWARHRAAHEALRGALGALGCERLAPEGEALAPLLAVRPPAGVLEDEATVRGRLLHEHGIEISGGLGPLAGRLWRVGVMGEGARPEPQRRLVLALAALLGRPADEPLDELERGWAAAAPAPVA